MLGGGETTGCDRKPPREHSRETDRTQVYRPSGLGIDLPTLFRWAPTLHHRLLSTMHPAEKDKNCLQGDKFFADP